MRRLIPVWCFAVLVACGGGSHSIPAPTPVPSASPIVTGGTPALWVADVRSANVVHIGSSGTPQLTLNGGISPAGVAVSSSGDVVVAGNQQSVLYFHAQAATPYNSFTSSSICGADGVALDFGDNVYVGDTLCPQIMRFSAGSTGPNVTPAATLNWDKAAYGGLLAFDVDPTGNVYLLTGDPGSARYILVYDFHAASGGAQSFTLLTKIPASTDFPNANGLAVDATHDIYVVNDNADVVVYSPTGDTTTPYARSWSAALDGLCNAYAVRHANLTLDGQTRSMLFTANGCGSSGGSQIVAYSVDTPAPSASPSPSPTPFTIDVADVNGARGITQKSTLAVDQSSGSVYVSTPLADIVTGYCKGCTGSAPPFVQFSLGYPGMDGIQALWFDNGLLYTMDAAAPAITVYAAPSKSASGIETGIPLARITGQDIGDLCGLAYVLTDAQHNLLVTLACPDENYVGKITLTGTPSGKMILPQPPADFSGTKGPCSAANPLCNPQQMALDASGNLYVTSYGTNPKVTINNGSIVKFSPTGALEAIMMSPDIHNPSGVAIDPHGNIAVLSNLAAGGTPEIAFFAPPANQASPATPLNVTPLYTISGSNTLIGAGTDTPFPPMQIGTDGTIYVNEYNDVLVFAPGASGNVAPKAVYQDTGTMTGGTGIALQP